MGTNNGSLDNPLEYLFLFLLYIEEEGTLQPPVCSRTRARFPMTDVDIDELVQQLCSEKESLIVPEENIEVCFKVRLTFYLNQGTC